MGQQPSWQQIRAAAGPRLRAAATAAQPIGVRAITSAEAAARQGASRLPPPLQQRLGLQRADASLRRRRRVAAAAASTLVAGLAAAETGRRSQELRQLGGELAQLRKDVRALGGRRARELARRRRRRQLIGVGVGISAAATATLVALRARRLRRSGPAARADEQPEPSELSAVDSDWPRSEPEGNAPRDY